MFKLESDCSREDDRDRLSTWHSRLAHADRNAIRKLSQRNAVSGIDITIRPAKNNYFPSIEGTMTNKPRNPRTVLKACRGAVGRTDVAEMNVTSVGRSKHIVKSIDEAFGQLGACHIKTKGKTDELLKQHIRCIEWQTDRTIGKIVLDGVKKFMHGSRNYKQTGSRSVQLQATILKKMKALKELIAPSKTPFEPGCYILVPLPIFGQRG